MEKTTNSVNTNIVSPIKFAELIGKRPQQVYGWIREGKMDSVLVETADGRKLVNVELGLEWFQNRPAKANSSAPTFVSNKPKQILEMLISWMENAGQKKIANDLRTKVLAEMENEAE
jgi:hypothetical protein